MSFKITSKMVHVGGSFLLDAFLKKAIDFAYIRSILDKYGRAGCEALASITPVDTGETAHSWEYEINKTNTGYTITWNNTHVNKGVNIAIILQYGHGTGTGGYVEGVDYINPALRPVFQNFADDAWREMME